MSNYSDGGDHRSSHGVDSITGKLLASIAHECSAIGSEIARLGAALSPLISSAHDRSGILELQTFDALAQNAHAQAALIAHLTRALLLGQTISMEDIAKQLEGVPLPSVRHRMHLAVGAYSRPGVAADDDATFWPAADTAERCQAEP